MDLNEVRKQMELFDEVIGTTNETGDEQMDQQQEVLHPNPVINKMLIANREKRARLKALGLKETHKKRKTKATKQPKKYIEPLRIPPFLQQTKEEFTINISSVQTRVINESLETLRNLGCTYEVSLNGQVWRHGVVPVADVKGGTRAPKDGAVYGSRSAYLRPYVKDLKVGKVVDIPFGDFHPHDLQSSVATICLNYYGAHNVTSHIDKKRKVLEVLRKR